MAFWAIPAVAQDDKGYLVSLLEDSLSGAGREVTIDGFEGLLSSEASLDRMQIADSQGVWLVLEEATLVWSRSALLAGRVEVDALSAARLEILRAPISDDSAMPEAQASEFSLPDLPVSVNIARLAVEELQLGAPLLGEEARLKIEASAALADGAGNVDITAERIDDKTGLFRVDAGFTPEDDVLRLAVLLEEDSEGLLAGILGLSGDPSLRLDLSGEAPLSDYTATLDLQADGAPVLAGEVTTALIQTDVAAPRQFTATLSGDIAGLFLPAYRPFFGDAISLDVAGEQGTDGLTLERMALETRSLTLEGRAMLNAQNWPVLLDISGAIAPEAGSTVLLPLPGDETRIGRAALDVDYDAAEGEAFAARFDLTGLDRADFDADALMLVAQGTLSPNEGSLGEILAAITLEATGLAPADPALADALGQAITLRTDLAYASDAPLRLRDLVLEGAGLRLAGDITTDGLSEGLETDLNLALQANDFSRFSLLAGRDMAGAGRLTLDGSAALGGAFDLQLNGVLEELRAGDATLDPLLRGQTRLVADIARDMQGTQLRTLEIANPALSLDASGQVAPGASDVAFAARVNDSALLTPQLEGPLSLEGTVASTGAQSYRVALQADGPFDAEAAINGDVTLADDPEDLPQLALEFMARMPEVARLVPQLSGPLDLDGSVESTAARSFAVALDASGPLAATARITAALDLPEGEAPAIDAELAARLPNIRALVPDLSGALDITGTARSGNTGTTIDLIAEGLAGTRARIAGLVGNDGGLDLAIDGALPLALANPFIAPRSVEGQARFDLALNGPAALSALSGQINVAQARASAPSLRVALDPINANVQISGGRAQTDLRAGIVQGGQLTLNGPFSLQAPFTADLALGLQGVTLVDPELYKTSATGQLSVAGPLTGGARITGAIELGQTDISIPSTGLASASDIPDIRHIRSPRPVRRTLQRAGLDAASREQSTAGSGGPAFPLDITVSAPARIFVRGRGLDAELGGGVRVTGSSRDPITAGQFELIRGRLDLLGKRFSLDEGTISLQGSLDPFINFVATTATEIGSAGIAIEGRASAPEIRFFSTPEAPEDEVLAQLLFGRDVSQISPFQALQLVNAVATLAGRGGEGVVSRLRRGFDLDDFDVTTNDSGATEVRAGKYLSDNLYTDVTVDSEGGSAVSLNLDLTPSVTARGKVAADGESSIGIFFERDY